MEGFKDISPRVKERVGEDGGGGRWTRSLVFRWSRGCEMVYVVGGVVEEGIPIFLPSHRRGTIVLSPEREK